MNLENPVLMAEVEALRAVVDRLNQMGDDDSQLGWQLRNLSMNLENALDRAWVDRSEDEEERAEGRRR